MKKEFKMKKTLALVMALSVAATSAANFSAFAAVVDPQPKDVKLTLKPNSASYLLTIPDSIDLIEKDSGKGGYIAASGGNDEITVSKADANVTSVNVKLSNADPTEADTINNGEETPVISDHDSTSADTKFINVILGGTYLKLSDSDTGVDFETDIYTQESKQLYIETRDLYQPAVTKEYTCVLTFKASSTS